MKFWLRYSKEGLLRYVGHLDMLRNWERILRRAQISLVFSQGFSPRPLLSLAAPLPVGLLSRAEYLELETTEDLLAAAARISGTLPSDMTLMGITPVATQTKSLMGLVRWADYTVRGLEEQEMAALQMRVADFLQQTSVWQDVARKSGTRRVDIRALVQHAEVQNGLLRLRLATGSAGNLRVNDFLQYLQVLNVEELQIRREELYLHWAQELVTPFQYAARSLHFS